ncbi:hypothetical protein ATCC90586_005192 [Pythium insidiosum]|nr:hypothetical protein ATCC90586_005192 [Pythium insidiosum]
MRGASFLCPLVSRHGGESPPSPRVHPLPTPDPPAAGDHVDAIRLGSILQSAPSELLGHDATPLSEDAMRALPEWMQRIARTGCFGRIPIGSARFQSPERRKRGPHGDDADGAPTNKRQKASYRKDHLRIVAEDDDDALPSSQDTDGGDDSTTRALFTHEERVAESVEKYSELFEQLLDSVQQRQQLDGVDSNGTDLLTASEIKSLLQSIKVMDRNGLIAKCDVELLLALMTQLDKQVQIGLSLDVLGTMALDEGDDEWQATGIDVRLIARRLLLPCIDTTVAMTPSAGAMNEEFGDNHAALPYDVEDEPLYIIYLINRYVTLKLGSTLQELRKEFATLGIAKDKILDEEFDLSTIDIQKYIGKRCDSEKLKSVVVQCCIAFAINLLIRVKFFLKGQYLLDNEKCHTYQPGSATKATDQSVVLADRSPMLELPPDRDLRCDNDLQLSWSLLCHTWAAAQEDQHQLDFDSHEDPGRHRKKKGRRRKTVAKVQVEDDDDEMVDGFDG